MTRLAVSERHFQAAVEELARLRAWRVYHAHDSRRSEPGWPDLAMCRGERLVCAELKTGPDACDPSSASGWRRWSASPASKVYLWREPTSWSEINRVLQ